MSRGNIVAQGWVSRHAYQVTFEARDGERIYEYDRASGIAIMAGADPHDFPSHEPGVTDIGEDLEDIAEIAELVAL